VKYRIEILPSAAKELKELPGKTQKHIVKKILSLGAEPCPQGAKKLKGSPKLYRIRIGKYRVVYKLYRQKITILILRIRQRKDAYR